MSASTLPLELLLQVFNALDARSFFAARKVCRWWHLASFDVMNMSMLLQKLPILPRIAMVPSDPNELHRLCNKASHTLMLETSVSEECEELGKDDSSRNMPSFPGVPTAVSPRSNTKAVLDGSTIRIFDTVTGTETLQQQHRVHEQFGRGLWLNPTIYSSHCQIALSANGSLLALAYKSAVQVYDLTAGSTRCFVSDAISNEHENHIVGLDFDQDDFLLRVHLTHKGHVVYLGSPPKGVQNEGGSATFEHWAGEGGLNHRFLDSALLTLPTSREDTRSTWLSGLQLLQPLPNGYLFAAQRHGGGRSSRYTLGYVTRAFDQETNVSIAEPRSAVEVARLESFLSAQDYELDGLADIGMGIWSRMPSAHVQQPTFRINEASTVLLLAEKEKKRIWPTARTEVFLYRLLGNKSITRSIEHAKAEKALLLRSDNIPKHECEDHHTVATIPICLGTVRGENLDATIECLEGRRASHRVTVVTDEGRHAWKLDRA